MAKWIFIFIVFLISMLLFSGCSSSPFPTGNYTRQLEGQQITLDFARNGSFKILRNGRVFAEGTYAVEGNELTWLTDSGCPSPNGETATYSWTLQNQSLTFRLVGQDICIRRLYLLEKLTYEKEP